MCLSICARVLVCVLVRVRALGACAVLMFMFVSSHLIWPYVLSPQRNQHMRCTDGRARSRD